MKFQEMLNVRFHYKATGLECCTTVRHFHPFTKIPLSTFSMFNKHSIIRKRNEINWSPILYIKQINKIRSLKTVVI